MKAQIMSIEVPRLPLNVVVTCEHRSTSTYSVYSVHFLVYSLLDIGSYSRSVAHHPIAHCPCSVAWEPSRHTHSLSPFSHTSSVKTPGYFDILRRSTPVFIAGYNNLVAIYAPIIQVKPVKI